MSHDGEVSAYCKGCGMDMWEYSDEAKEDGWCISCAPECYVGGVHINAADLTNGATYHGP